MDNLQTKPLKLSYELSWRAKDDERFSRSVEWKNIRSRILTRDGYTCRYCGFKAEKGMQVNHIDGNPKNHDDANLEVVCPSCHMIMHSGLWAAVRGVILIFRKSKYTQNEIIRITREMRATGKNDVEIIAYLGLEEQVPWKENLNYLSGLFGFISSRLYTPTSKPLLSEEEQRDRLHNRSRW